MPRLLLAEDDLSVQRVAVRMIERLGWQVDTTESGLRAVEAVLSVSYDAVLLDFGLHDIGGLEVARRIRAGETARRTPLIAITGDSGASARQRCLDAGMDDYLAKPLSIAALRATLAKWGATRDRTRVPSGERRAVSAEPETLSEKLLLEAAGGDPMLLADLAVTFVSDCESRVAEIARAVAAGDVDKRLRFAHKLKGAAAMVGALRLAHLAEHLESPMATDAIETSGALAAELETLRARLRPWIG